MGSLFKQKPSAENEKKVVAEVVSTFKRVDQEHFRLRLEQTMMTFFPSLASHELKLMIQDCNGCLKTFAIKMVRAELYGGGPLPGTTHPSKEREREIDEISKPAANLCECDSTLCKLLRGDI